MWLNPACELKSTLFRCAAGAVNLIDRQYCCRTSSAGIPTFSAGSQRSSGRCLPSSKTSTSTFVHRVSGTKATIIHRHKKCRGPKRTWGFLEHGKKISMTGGSTCRISGRYAYRISNALANPVIVCKKLLKRRSGWTNFISLAEKLGSTYFPIAPAASAHVTEKGSRRVRKKVPFASQLASPKPVFARFFVPRAR